jgi:hypothetical protein
MTNGTHDIESVLSNQLKSGTIFYQVYSISVDKCTNVKQTKIQFTVATQILTTEEVLGLITYRARQTTDQTNSPLNKLVCRR